MADPKYTPTDSGIMHEDGYMIPNDEPLMIFRGKDIGSLSAIVDYIEMLQDQPLTPTIDSHLKSSAERLLAFYNYQVLNPDLQSVGCSRRSHADAVLFLSMAKNKLVELGLSEEVAA